MVRVSLKRPPDKGASKLLLVPYYCFARLLRQSTQSIVMSCIGLEQQNTKTSKNSLYLKWQTTLTCVFASAPTAAVS